ncbi:MAG: glycosyltransferase [Ilumatobacteraceae bacterium]
MPVRIVSETESEFFDLGPGPAIVAIPVYDAADMFRKCIESVLRHTPAEAQILIIDDCGRDQSALAELNAASASIEHDVVLFQRRGNRGFVAACNLAFSIGARRDVVLLNSDCIVGAEWYERMCAAAATSPLVATVTALTNHGTIVSVPYRNRPTHQLPGGVTVDDAAARVSSRSLALRPDLPTAVGHCMLVLRHALDLVGGFDTTFSPGYGEEVDFSQRCLKFGLRNICADDVFVFHHGGGSFAGGASQMKEDHECVIASRYPYYHRLVDVVSNDRRSPLASAINIASAAIVGLRVGIDARKLGPHSVGTDAMILGSIWALARAYDPDPVVVFFRPSAEIDMLRLASDLKNLVLIDVDRIGPLSDPLVDIVYRPCQVDGWEDLVWLKSIGRTVVVNQLDGIAFANPTYFEDVEEWLGYRDLTRLVLSCIDAVVTISDESAAQLHAFGVVGQAIPLAAIPPGLGTPWVADGDCSIRPKRMGAEARPFLLYIGTSYHHKNRLFCVRLFDELLRSGWEGDLVFAGPTPPHGSSHGDEASYLLTRRDVRKRIVDLGVVTAPERTWLLEHAALCLYPSVVEGFGIVPLEAAAYGTPVLSSRVPSLTAIGDDDYAVNSFDLASAVDRARVLLARGPERQQAIEAIISASSKWDWDASGSDLRRFIEGVFHSPLHRYVGTTGEVTRALGLEPLAVPHHTAIRGSRFERLVDVLRRQTSVKRIISPDYSRRQRVTRRFIHAIRVRQSRSLQKSPPT